VKFFVWVDLFGEIVFMVFSVSCTDYILKPLKLVVAFSIVPDLTSALTSTTRRESIHGGSASASMLPTVVEAITEFMPPSLVRC
jgi:hypothetical protein